MRTITTAMFAIVDALILRPVPFAASDQLAFVYTGNDRGGHGTVSPGPYFAPGANPAFRCGRVRGAPVTALIEVDGAVVARGMARVAPWRLRCVGDGSAGPRALFDAAEVCAAITDRVLLSEELWRTFYHSDAGLAGPAVSMMANP